MPRFNSFIMACANNMGTDNTNTTYNRHRMVAPTHNSTNATTKQQSQGHQQPTAPTTDSTKATCNGQPAPMPTTAGTKATGSTNESTKRQDQGHRKPTAPTAITIQRNKATDN
jgi:hypothetical protein